MDEGQEFGCFGGMSSYFNMSIVWYSLCLPYINVNKNLERISKKVGELGYLLMASGKFCLYVSPLQYAETRLPLIVYMIVGWPLSLKTSLKKT